MKCLVTGASSLMARYFIRTEPEGVDVICSYRNYCPNPAISMPLERPEDFNFKLNIINPDVLIHCAGEGDVDKTEKDPESVRKINVDAVKKLVAVCRARNIKFVYMSSNAVFKGDEAPYSELDPRMPVNQYGELKMEAENAVMECNDWLIIRPILLYGWPYINSRSNFVTRTVKSLSEGKEIQVVNDTLTQPTYAQDFCEAVWGLLGFTYLKPKPNEPGIFTGVGVSISKNQIFHIASEENTTLYGLALKTARIWGFDKGLVKLAKSSDFPTIAPRPKDTTYDLTKLHDLGIKCKGIQEGLTAMKEEK
jgi:dTDP-4-dehydrorhamnose reductase